MITDTENDGQLRSTHALAQVEVMRLTTGNNGC